MGGRKAHPYLGPPEGNGISSKIYTEEILTMFVSESVTIIRETSPWQQRPGRETLLASLITILINVGGGGGVSRLSFGSGG